MSINVQTIAQWTEPCDCGDQIRHNNGGNYHRTESVYAVAASSVTIAVLRVEDDTSDTVAGDAVPSLLGWPCGCLAIEYRERGGCTITPVRACSDHGCIPLDELAGAESLLTVRRYGTIDVAWQRPVD